MGNNSSKITAQDKAILDLKTQRDKLHQYQRRITILTDRETTIARQLIAAHDKPRALLALRRKKYQETLLKQTDAQLEQLEQLTSKVEFALIQKDIVFGLQQGTKVLTEIHREMGGIEHVEKLMGQSEDAVAYQNEISEMLGGKISNQDEEEVEDELAALEAEVTGATRTTTPATTEVLPNVPDAELMPKDTAKMGQQQPTRQRQPERQAMLAE